MQPSELFLMLSAQRKSAILQQAQAMLAQAIAQPTYEQVHKVAGSLAVLGMQQSHALLSEIEAQLRRGEQVEQALWQSLSDVAQIEFNWLLSYCN